MADWRAVLLVLLYVYIFITIFYLLLDNRETATTLSWLLVFLVFPFVGIVFYFLFGRGMRKKVRKTLLRQNLEGRLAGQGRAMVERQKWVMDVLLGRYVTPVEKKIIRLMYRNSDSILSSKNKVQVFFNGRDKFDQLLEDLEKAQRYIHMEYFIWKNDYLSQKVVQVLEERVAQGVEVRILYDVIGNYLNSRYRRKLRAMGIKIYPYFNFASPLRIHTLNYRNHRKIVVIDGTTGYLGGMNMGEEYIDGGRRFPHWRDTHLRIQGEAVAVLQEVFNVSWFNTTREELTMESDTAFDTMEGEPVHVQITTSGPDSAWESIQQLYFLLISSAEHSIYIHTPYFIPDASIVMALQTAALGGIDVRIILTGLLDKRLPYWAALTFIGDLLTAGVRFFYYTRGFMHAKTIVVDDKCCSVGTANMDIRSFQLNYEINALMYDEILAGKIVAMFHQDLEFCREFTRADYDKISRPSQLRNSLARLFAPLL
ncbi:Cls [Desulforapulum autotrophicum HRM2]|uniref:Cardiolipin synthase n=1 Tax=Desulforapulum autotrophicum (strain ATCC 43914 / DSM 3382 / VKM B-1955 / HRM2) TaxID=177437 RepID=C0QIT7_DESAH|nr:cardiolipin synthase [Desulforapulum autotrophicum]ACN13727.1 Cls [Desulforapulum autotrophicum HRM2]